MTSGREEIIVEGVEASCFVDAAKIIQFRSAEYTRRKSKAPDGVPRCANYIRRKRRKYFRCGAATGAEKKNILAAEQRSVRKEGYCRCGKKNTIA